MLKGETLDTASDEELMLEFARGGQECFAVLYKRYSSRVYGYLKRRLGEAAEEAFQESFLRMVKARSSFNNQYSFSPWLFSIVHNCMVDSLRKATGRKKLTERLYENPLPEETPDMSDKLNTILDSLSERDRRVLQLHFMEDLSFNTVASRMGLTAANVRQIASRVIRRLRRETL